MLSDAQLSLLTPSQREEYEQSDEEGKVQFEYFYGFTHGTVEEVVVTNAEVIEYQKAARNIQLKSVAKLINFVPHKGQQPVFYAFDAQSEIYNNFVLLFGRRTGKSYVTSVIIVRELLLPHSSTILLAPTFNNSQIIYRNVMKIVDQLGLPVKSVNRGQFKLELQNGAKFSANSEMNVEASLGSSQSLVVTDEAQSVTSLKRIIDQLLTPTLLDFGTRDSGILWGKLVFLGTPRGEDNTLTDYFRKSETLPNWRSFQAPSMSNPTLPQAYFETMKLEMPDLLFRQEILAEIIGGDDNVFHAFHKTINTYSHVLPDVLPEGRTMRNYFVPSKDDLYVCGIDIGWSDSTANLFIYRTSEGRYYIEQAYSKNTTTTAVHVQNYRDIEDKLPGECDVRYCDPAAAQTINDYILTYDYDVQKAANDVMASLQYINQLFAPSGVNQEPKLYIHEDLLELIRQTTRIRFKPQSAKKSNDPFTKDPEGTHWDMIAALRYALFSDRYNVAALNIISC